MNVGRNVKIKNKSEKTTCFLFLGVKDFKDFKVFKVFKDFNDFKD